LDEDALKLLDPTVEAHREDSPSGTHLIFTSNTFAGRPHLGHVAVAGSDTWRSQSGHAISAIELYDSSPTGS
jgi:hypothetical protein